MQIKVIPAQWDQLQGGRLGLPLGLQAHIMMAYGVSVCVMQRDHICRLAAAQKRDKYETRHLGNFRRIYPSPAAPLQAKYEWLLQGSARMFASSMKAKAHNTIGRIQVLLLLHPWPISRTPEIPKFESPQSDMHQHSFRLESL